ncbi:hypothetical protein KI387_013371, partial [Taxus chinensis]
MVTPTTRSSVGGVIRLLLVVYLLLLLLVSLPGGRDNQREPHKLWLFGRLPLGTTTARAQLTKNPGSGRSPRQRRRRDPSVRRGTMPPTSQTPGC